MKTILCSVLLLLGVTSQAAYVTVSVTFTNRTIVGDDFTRGATLVKWTNAPLNNQTWITTNSPAGSATNLVRHYGANVPAVYARMTSPTNVLLSGNDLQFSIGANRYAVLTTNTATTTNFHALLIPWDTQIYATNRTNDAEEVIYGLSKYARTNAFAANAAAMTNFVGLTNQQVLFNKKLTNTIAKGGTNDSMAFTNISSAGLSNVYAVGVFERDVTSSNVALQRLTGAWGTLGGGWLTNGYLSGFGAINFTVTNLNAPGTGSASQQIGTGADAAGAETIAFGVGAYALTNQTVAIGQAAGAVCSYDIAIGWQAVSDYGGFGSVVLGASGYANVPYATAIGYNADVQHTNSVALGANATTTAPYQVRLGTATEHVSIPGEIRDAAYTNNTFRGSNSWNGDWAFTPRTDAAVIAGYVSAINLGTNNYVRITGASGAFTNASFTGLRTGQRVLVEAVNPGLSCVLLHNSSIGSPASTEQINTGTGALVNLTNNPALFEVIHNGSKVLVLWHSN